MAFGCRLDLSYRTDPVVGVCWLFRRWYWTHHLYGVLQPSHGRAGQYRSFRLHMVHRTKLLCELQMRASALPGGIAVHFVWAEIHSPAALPRHCGRSLGVRCSCRMKKGPFLLQQDLSNDSFGIKLRLELLEGTPGCRKLRQQTRKVETLVSSSSLLVWLLSSKAAAVGCCEAL